MISQSRTLPLVLEQGSVIGHIEEVAIVDKEDDVWKEGEEPSKNGDF